MKKLFLPLAAVLFVFCGSTIISCGGNKDNKVSTEQGSENNSDSKARKRVEKTLEQAKSSLPQRISRSMQLTSLEIEGNYVVYTVVLERGFDQMEINDESRAEVLGTIEKQGGTFVDAGLGVKYKYVKAGTDESKVLTIEPAELAANCNKN